MAISQRLDSYLKAQGVDYALITHPRTESSMTTAAAARVPGDRLAKAVIVGDDAGWMVVVVPSDYHVHLGALHRHLGRTVGLATEPEVVDLFPGCDEGAVPPIGAAFGLPTLVDERLLDAPEVFFESGDHEHLVRVSGDQFRALLAEADVIDVGQHV
ncbi:MAG: YbaK/EbsC family protein [Chromatiaceae bacterium]|jgi:Ala-tRNA(Pro) deacylase|nr:YbaK/EbsC family protein [Chromatiaceae bacterium]